MWRGDFAPRVWMNAEHWNRGGVISSSTHRIRYAGWCVRSVKLNVNTRWNWVGASRLQVKRNRRNFGPKPSSALFRYLLGESCLAGAFIVIDPLSNETLGAGMITGVEGRSESAWTGFLLKRSHGSVRTSRRGSGGRRHGRSVDAGARVVQARRECGRGETALTPEQRRWRMLPG